MGVNKSNFIVREIAPQAIFESILDLLDTADSFEQGDHLALVGGKVQNLTAVGDTATYLGISRVTVVSGKIKQPYTTDVDASQGVLSVAGPQYGVEALFEAKAADAFNPGDLVSVDGANLTRGVTITIASASAGIGFYNGPAIASAAAGQLIAITLITPVLAQAVVVP